MNTIYNEIGDMVRTIGFVRDGYSALGNVNVSLSDDGHYILFNYSQEAMLSNSWNKYEVVCRGLVYDRYGFCVANPFDKFFNLGQQGVFPATLMAYGGQIVMTEKMDGSLGVIFFDRYADKWRIVTRGSFNSDQAIRGQQILDSYVDLGYIPRDLTIMCEIIYPENMSVLRYGEEALYFLGVRTRSGEELSFIDNIPDMQRAGFKIPSYEIQPNNAETWKIIEDYQKTAQDQEGYVLMIEGETENHRVKAKTDWYFAMHKLVWGLSTKTIFEAYVAGLGNVDSMLANLPDEFVDMVKARCEVLAVEEFKIADRILNDYRDIKDMNLKTRKDFALEAVKHQNKAALFALYQGQPIQKFVYKEMEDMGLGKVEV